MLAGNHPAGAETAAIARPVYRIVDRHAGVAGPQKIGMERMTGSSRINCSAGRDQRLAQDLPAEHALNRFGR